MLMLMQLPFDRVVVEGGDQPRMEFTTDAFLALPLHKRVNYMLQRKVQFFLAGALVERTAALRALMQRGSAQAA